VKLTKTWILNGFRLISVFGSVLGMGALIGGVILMTYILLFQSSLYFLVFFFIFLITIFSFGIGLIKILAMHDASPGDKKISQKTYAIVSFVFASALAIIGFKDSFDAFIISFSLGYLTAGVLYLKDIPNKIGKRI
jgi:hypothetical protein